MVDTYKGKIKSQYNPINGDLDTSDIGMKLSEDINNFIFASSLRSGYGSNIPYLKKTDPNITSIITNKLNTFINNLYGVESCSISYTEGFDNISLSEIRFTIIVKYNKSLDEVGVLELNDLKVKITE